MKTLKRILFLLVLLFTHYILFAQTCNSITFSSPEERNTCTYTFKNFDWENQFGKSSPTLFDINIGESISIISNNSNDLGTVNETLFTAPGIVFNLD